jgi:uncharacterized protein (TIGR02145 family)
MRKIILITFLSAVSGLAISQVPQGINYQAVLSNSSGMTVPNTTIQVKAAILSDTLTPVVIWEELHSTVRTNASGVFNLVIGTGIKQSGSASEFSSIDWSVTPLYLEIQIYYQSTWKYLGTSQLWSVPYAMYSGNNTDLTDLQAEISAIETGLQTEIDATETGLHNEIDAARTDLLAEINATETGLQNEIDVTVTDLQAEINATETGLLAEIDATQTGAGLNNNGNYTANLSANYIATATSLKDADNKLDAQAKKNSDKIAANSSKMVIKGVETSPDSALFRVVNKDGQTVFAVYNEGVRIYVDDGAKGTKGGFAVGGFGTSKADSQNLLYVDTDSIRAYVNIDPAKGVKGGFAVGGFGTSKGTTQDLLVVNADSIRAYIDTNTGKGVKGGFAVGGFGSTKSAAEEYLRITRDSTRIYLNDTETKGAKGGFSVGGFGTSKGLPNNYMVINPDSTRFYVREIIPGTSSTFDIIGINLDQTQTLLLTANTDTIGIGAVLTVHNNLNVEGNIGYTGEVTMIAPEIGTIDAFNISNTSAMVMCDIISNGGAAVIVSGVCWSTSPGPTVDLATKTIDGTSEGQYTSVITGLTENTTYYVRAYATNSNGTGYGVEMMFATPPSVTDYDGNVYNTIIIGTQLWMASNLRTTTLNDGVPIPNVTNDTVWMNLLTPGYAWYANDAITYSDYGLLYNWQTVNTETLCPTGWHVPSEGEWYTLRSYLGVDTVAGGMLKETGTTHWLDPNTAATDEVGFTALPGGMRSYMGPFLGIGEMGYFWTSTIISVDAMSAVMYYDSGTLMLQMMMSQIGQSVRCVEGTPPAE